MKDNKRQSIIKLILDNKRVNNYTKMLIILNTLDYYNDYYIPNKKLMNMLGINKNRVIVLLHQLEEDGLIKITYKGRKRNFIFLGYVNQFIDDLENNEKKEEEKYKDIFDYDWLNEME